ncbi:MAG: TIM-barrel domain-containing protein [Phycisphaerales bacterium JB039]
MRLVTAFVLQLVLAALLATPALGGQLESRMLEPGVYRLDASAEARRIAAPSLSFVRPAERETPGEPTEAPVDATFAQLDDGRWSVSIALDDSFDLYGTGEVAGPLERTGRTVVTWNTDAYGYGDSSLSLYQSHPWVLAVDEDGRSLGLLADTTYRCEIDLTDGVRFTAEGEPFPLIVIDGPSPQDVLVRLTDLTGRIAMPPKWAIGYHQCRYSYYPDERALEVASEFRQRDIPCDVIWLDIHYMDEYRVFTFDPERFPNPAGLNASLHDMGFRTVWMIDPGIKAEPGYVIYDSGAAGDHWVLTSDGEPYIGEVWPGPCVFPDYTREETRRWWAGLYSDFLATGIDGVWNDMNEPAVFNVESKTMPEDNVHRADAVLGGPDTHDRYHNVYGMLMVKATREGVLSARPEKRPFVLSRASFIGGHRYGAAWTGDNQATWEHLEMSIPMTLNMGLSGQPFAGPDIGGFIGDGDGQMFARWMGFGALLPFARGHTDVRSRDKEPWAFGPEVEQTCRLAIQRRYELLPYYYTLFHEAAETGLPVVRPLFFADLTDPALRTEDDAFLIGADLIAAPSLTPSHDRVSVLPASGWAPVRLTGADDPDLPRMFIRDGAIVPTGPVMDYADQLPLDPLTLLVRLDDAGRASGRLYEDAGEGWGHLEGDYLLTTYEAQREGDNVIVRIGAEEGRRDRADRALRVRLILDNGEEIEAAGRDGEALRIPLR